MIEYKTRASQANLFLSENDINIPIHHYMYINPKNFDKVTINDVILAYQKYLENKYNQKKRFILDPSIPFSLNIYSEMKFSDYINIKNTKEYHLQQGDYYYLPIISEKKSDNDFVLV